MSAKSNLFSQSITELRAALAEDPNRPDLQVVLANNYVQTGQRLQAIEACSSLINKLPYCLEANRILAYLLPGTERASEAEEFRRRYEALDPYAAFASPSAPGTDQVQESSVTLERLEYAGGKPPEVQPPQPEWAAAIGVALESEPSEEEVPEWLASLGKELPSTETIAPPEGYKEEKSAEPEIPDWMRTAGWVAASGSAEEGPHGEEIVAAESAAQEELPDWLREDVTAAPPAAESGVAGGTIIAGAALGAALIADEKGETFEPTETEPAPEPTELIEEVSPAPAAIIGAALVEAEEQITPEELVEGPALKAELTSETGEVPIPDWLQDLAEAEPPAGVPPVPVEPFIEEPPAELPEWLEQTVETPPLEVQPVKTPSGDESELAPAEFPEWLRAMEDSVFAEAVLETSQVSPATPLVIEPSDEAWMSEEIPDWLKAAMGAEFVSQVSKTVGEETPAETAMAAGVAAIAMTPEGETVPTVEEQPEPEVLITPLAEQLQAEAIPETIVESVSVEAAGGEAEVVEPEVEEPALEVVAPAVAATVISEEIVEAEAPEEVEAKVQETIIPEVITAAAGAVLISELGEEKPPEEARAAEVVMAEAAVQEIQERPGEVQEPGVAEVGEIEPSQIEAPVEAVPAEELPEETQPVEVGAPEVLPIGAAASIAIPEEAPMSEDLSLIEPSLEKAEMLGWLEEQEELAEDQTKLPVEETSTPMDLPTWLKIEAMSAGAVLPELAPVEPSIEGDTQPVRVSVDEKLAPEAAEAVIITEAVAPTGEELEISEGEVETPELADEAAALAWLEGLALKQGAAEEELVTKPEERPEEMPEWILKEAETEAEGPSLAEVALIGGVIAKELEGEPSEAAPEMEETEVAEVVAAEAVSEWVPSAEVTEPITEVELPEEAGEPPVEAGEPYEWVPATEAEAESEVPVWLKDYESAESQAAPITEPSSWIAPAVATEAFLTQEPAKPAEITQLDLNAASLVQLERVPGLGFILAQNIINYREMHGPFSNIDELTNVPGFSAEAVADLHNYLSVAVVSEAPPAPSTNPVLVSAWENIASGDIDAAVEKYNGMISQQDQLDEVINDLHEAIRLHPAEVSLYQALGDAYVRQNRLQEALNAYNRAEDLLR
jgi:competence ComEA-like helix-hairpin-helix protein